MNGQNSLYDLIIIGGGINGTGIARDAAERGLSVFLAERGDFGGGTSAHSTRLIHGGLRYLEHFDFGLVRESLREREILLKIAPHLVSPIELALPVYRWSRYGFMKVRLGLMLYDTLAAGKSLPSHRSLSRADFHKMEPNLEPEGLVGGFLYYDCQVTYPERLCVENILSAQAAGAWVCNHTEVTAFILENQQLRGVRILNRLNGQEETVYGRFVINASGPWLDAVCKLLEQPSRQKIGGTKGSHLVVSPREGLPKTPLYTPARSDGRPFFILPWRDLTLIGTTDIPFDGNLDDLRIGEEEIAYLIAETNALLPRALLRKEDILYTFAGVRPLPPGDSDAGEITRRHFLYDHEKEDGIYGLVSVIGGKLTTYRSLAEEATDLVFKKLGRPAPPCATHTRPLYGGAIGRSAEFLDRYTESKAQEFDVSPETVGHLISLYGSRFERVLILTMESPDLKDPLAPGLPDIGAQAAYAAQQEMAQTLEDFLLRRTGIGMEADCGLAASEPAARLLGRFLKWDEGRIRKEQVEYRETIAHRRVHPV